MDSCAQFLAAAEHRLIPSRARSVGHSLRGADHHSVWSLADQDKVAGCHAGVGVVSLGAVPLALPTFAVNRTPSHVTFFSCFIAHISMSHVTLAQGVLRARHSCIIRMVLLS